MASDKEGDVSRREFLHNILIGIILMAFIVPFSIIVSDKMVVGFGADADTIASRMILVFGTLILIIYSLMVFIVKIIVHFLKSESEKAMVESSQQVTGTWYKWLIAVFLIFVIVVLLLKMK